MRVGVAAVVMLSWWAGCVLPPGEPCCRADADCVDGARCFEHRCALRCVDDSQCDEGSLCVDEAHVCRAADPSRDTLESCEP